MATMPHFPVIKNTGFKMIIQIATLRDARDRRALQRAMGETQGQ